MSFTTPIALLGLLTIPYFIWLGRPKGWGRGRALVSMALRALIVASLVLALAGFQIVRSSDQLAVVFLIDASDSMPPATVEQARQFAEQGISGMRPDDQAAIIVFGSDARVERPMTPSREVGPLQSDILSLNTDLAEAIRLGLALYPPGAARRMVILSDGLANVGDAADAARLAEASGVQIVAVPYQAITGAEVLVTDVDVPTRLSEGQVFDLTVTIESSTETTAILRVLSGSQVAVEETVALVEGLNRYAFTLTATQPGLTSFRVQLVPAGEDTFYQNNELSAFAQIVGPPRILLVADDDIEIGNLGDALLAQDFQIDRVTSGGLPPDLATLSSYQSIVLVNIPARNLGNTKMRVLQSYVRDLGGGLVVVGGPNAYGVGGYFQTPLEEILPVEMQLKDQERLPQLTVVYVIDKSGSMADTSVGGIPKVELAKEAILRSIQLLGPLDRLGVVAFDENAQWVVPLGPIGDRSEAARLVATIRASGGTDIYAGVLAVSKMLPEDPSRLRHIVLLTDGGAAEEGIPELVTEMYEEHGITMSVIAIGQGYAPFIEDLPDLADGRFHFAYDVSTIPEIFTEETVIATRAYIIEGQFFPVLTSTSPIMSGISSTPPLTGYIGTTIKPTAQQILASDVHSDPLLASWQYGLGRAVAWTSDATGRWAADWSAWPEFPRFWSQAVRWTITEGATSNVEVQVVQEGEQVRVVVDAESDEGEYLNGLDMTANIVGPDLEGVPIDLYQVAPGRYEGVFEPDEEGAYFVRVAGGDPQDEADAIVAQTSGWVLAYSPEYRSFTGDPDYLAFLSGLTGGGIVANPADVFAHNLQTDRASQPVWPWLLLAAVTLLPFDIAVRRLLITRTDLERIRAAIVPGVIPPPEPRTSSVGALFAAKERAGEAVEQRQSGLPTIPSRSEAPDSVNVGSGGVRQQPPPGSPTTARSTPTAAQGGGSTASSLLARKRARRDDDS